MYRTELEVVNACIATMGEAPLNSLQDEHQFKQAALNYLAGSNMAAQKECLWFNTEAITLPPHADSKFIYVPQDTIHIARLPGQSFAFQHRGARLYNVGKNTYEWDGPLRVALCRLLPFEDCPFMAQDSISLDAVLRFQREYDGDVQRYNLINADRGRALVQMSAENIRQRDVNLLAAFSVRAAALGVVNFTHERYSSGPNPMHIGG